MDREEPVLYLSWTGTRMEPGKQEDGTFDEEPGQEQGMQRWELWAQLHKTG